MCGRIPHAIAAAGHGAAGALVVLGSMPADAQAALSPAARVVLVAAGAAGAVPMSGGRRSPDLDQFGSWKQVDRALPDELLLFGGPMKHRGILHWWGLPAAGTWLLVQACHTVPLAVAVLLVVAAWVPLAGVWSHLYSDFWIGGAYLGGKRPEADDPACAWDRKSTFDADDHPRGPGLPLFPWWLHLGTGWRIGTGAEFAYLGVCLAVGAAAGVGAWRGAAPSWSWPVAVGALALHLVIGVNGYLRFRRRLASARRSRPAFA